VNSIAAKPFLSNAVSAQTLPPGASKAALARLILDTFGTSKLPSAVRLKDKLPCDTSSLKMAHYQKPFARIEAEKPKLTTAVTDSARETRMSELPFAEKTVATI